MADFLIKINVVQKKIDGNRFKKEKYRLNKWHPLTYIWVIIFFFVGLYTQGIPKTIFEIKQSFKWK